MSTKTRGLSTSLTSADSDINKEENEPKLPDVISFFTSIGISRTSESQMEGLDLNVPTFLIG